MVYYGSLAGVKEPLRGKGGYGEDHIWDVPLLDGYTYKVIKNISPIRSVHNRYGIFPIGLRRELQKESFDAILIHGWGMLLSWVGYLSALLTNTPILIRCEASEITEESLKKIRLRSRLLNWLFVKVDAALAIGTLNKEFYLKKKLEEEQIFHTPYAVDNEHFFQESSKNKKKADEKRRDLGIPQDAVVILYLSGMKSRKRPMDLLKAFIRVKERDNVYLVFAGAGEVYEELKDTSSACQNVKLVRFVNQSEIGIYYAMANLFILPSVDEPWGLVINEAMCHSLPIITTTKVGAAKDLIVHGKNGFIYEPGNVEQLSTYISYFLCNPEKLREMGEQSKDIIKYWSYQEDLTGILEALRYLKGKK